MIKLAQKRVKINKYSTLCVAGFQIRKLYINKLVYTGWILKFEISKYKQIILQKLKLSENHPDMFIILASEAIPKYYNSKIKTTSWPPLLPIKHPHKTPSLTNFRGSRTPAPSESAHVWSTCGSQTAQWPQAPEIEGCAQA